MKGYVIANVDIHDMEIYSGYRARTPGVIAQYGGKFLIRGGTFENAEGDMGLKRLVVVEFPSFEQARTFYNSPEYQEILKIRQASATTHLVIAEGFDG